ncbi:MAG: flagellar hook-length control protein FliK [Gammaproteobacteria bacterium]|nr:flagellar hook-length control protein FliK [Gammaproteobacteria bacterium]
MQVLPIKVDSYSDQSTDSDVTTANATAPIDFATLINSPETQSQTLPNSAKLASSLPREDSKAAPKSSDSLDPSAVALTASLTQEMNFFVGQIDLANQVNQVENTPSGLNADESTDAVSLNQSNLALSERPAASTELMQSQLMPQNQSISEATTMDRLQAEAAIQNDSLPTKVDPNQKPNAEVVKKNDSNTKPININKPTPTTTTLKNSLDKVNLSDASQKNVAIDNAQSIDKNMKPAEKDLNQDTNSAFGSLPANNITMSQAISSMEKEPIKEGQSKPANKFTDSLNELGNLINGLTAQHANHQEQLISLPNIPAASTSMSYAEALKKVNHAEFDTQVELIPQSIESQLNDSYSANIKIYPPELGHVLAKLKVDKNNAELIITTENSTVKSIVESNLAQLRDNFQRADINITNIQVNVSDVSDKEQKNNQPYQSNQNVESNHATHEIVKENGSPTLSKRTLNSIIDAYI